MRMCQAHWTKMRSAVDSRGMTHLIAGSGQEAADRAVREVEAAQEGEKPPVSDFDPLSAMMWNFANRVMESIGLALMGNRVEPDGMPENRDDEGFNHCCPLCIVQRSFNAHNTPSGRCGVLECTIQIKSGETAWDDRWIEECADAMHKYAVDLGLVKKQ